MRDGGREKNAVVFLSRIKVFAFDEHSQVLHPFTLSPPESILVAIGVGIA